MENLAAEKFNIRNWITEGERDCGSVCCAIGWFPKIFPRTFKWASWSIKKINGYCYSEYDLAAAHLDTTTNEAMDLFTGVGNILGENPTPQMLAARLRNVYKAKIAR